jgi:aspartate 1-decarboxylase
MQVLLSKINCKVTDASFDYKGSITIDSDIMAKVGLKQYQVVDVNNCNGNRDVTYVIKGKSGSGIIACNGALAARHKKGDKIHINAYGYWPRFLLSFHKPKEYTILK